MNEAGTPPARRSPAGDGDETFPGLLLFVQKANEAAEKIKRAIIAASGGPQRLRAELPATDRVGTTTGMSYDTTKAVLTYDKGYIWQHNRRTVHASIVHVSEDQDVPAVSVRILAALAGHTDLVGRLVRVRLPNPPPVP